MKLTFTLALMIIMSAAWSQMRIDDTFAFQTDPNKQYSIYVPSGYMDGTPHKMMLGLHPLNTNRWNSVSWCDTLIVFAETNNLLLVCPDGGVDGAVDDPIDTAFTTALLDSMLTWYSVDEEKIYAMGFSVGGRATYSYGLNHIDRFGGFIPIGAAITGLQGLDNLMPLADSIPYYIVHGNNDAPATRFFPIRDSLIANGAFVNSILMSGVGHTIDFPNRNQILTDAYTWVDSVNCANKPDEPDTATGIQQIQSVVSPFTLMSSGNASSDVLHFKYNNSKQAKIYYELISMTGQVLQGGYVIISPQQNVHTVSLRQISSGVHLIRLSDGDQVFVGKFIKR